MTDEQIRKRPEARLDLAVFEAAKLLDWTSIIDLVDNQGANVSWRNQLHAQQYAILVAANTPAHKAETIEMRLWTIRVLIFMQTFFTSLQITKFVVKFKENN